MKLRGTSQDIDQVQAQAMVLSFFQDERPLKGSTGLTDWRMCGRFSKLIMSRFIDGRMGEPLLMPASHQLPVDKILLFGLGQREKFDLEQYKKVVGEMCDVLRRLQVTQFSLALPGITLSNLEPAEAAEILGKTVPSRFGPDHRLLEKVEVTVVADRNQLKSINPVLARLERSFR
jgi:hypothetical protein